MSEYCHSDSDHSPRTKRINVQVVASGREGDSCWMRKTLDDHRRTPCKWQGTSSERAHTESHMMSDFTRKNPLGKLTSNVGMITVPIRSEVSVVDARKCTGSSLRTFPATSNTSMATRPGTRSAGWQIWIPRHFPSIRQVGNYSRYPTLWLSACDITLIVFCWYQNEPRMMLW